MIDRKARCLIGIIVALAGVYLVGNAHVALWDRDEPRYAQTSRQMLESGDWVVPRLMDEVRTAKPIFIYWCQAGAMRLLGDTPFAARLPSVVSMALVLVLVGASVARVSDWERATWTVLVLGTSALVIAWCARNALTDGVLLLWITIAQICLYRVWSSGRMSWADAIVWGAAVGLAGLTKGPVVLAVQGMTGLALVGMWWWDRRKSTQTSNLPHPDLSTSRGVPRDPTERERTGASPAIVLKFSVAIAVIAVVVGPWLYLVQQREPSFLRTTLAHDVVKRAVTPLEQHTGPPGYYLATIWGTFFPWSLFLPMGLIFAWRHRRHAAVRFAFAAVVGPWILFEIVQTKLPHYVLPLFPPLAFLTADALVRCFRSEEDDMLRPSFLVGASIWAVAVLLIGLAPWLVVRWFTPIPVGATIVWSVVSVAYAVSVFALFVAEKPKRAATVMAGGMMLAMIVALGWYLPRAWYIRLPVRVAEVLRRDGAIQTGQVQMIGYKEPSLAFYQGGTIREQREDDFLINHSSDQWPRWIVIRGDIWQRTPVEVRSQFEVVDELRGWSYADKGKIRYVVVARKR